MDCSVSIIKNSISESGIPLNALDLLGDDDVCVCVCPELHMRMLCSTQDNQQCCSSNSGSLVGVDATSNHIHLPVDSSKDQQIVSIDAACSAADENSAVLDVHKHESPIALPTFAEVVLKVVASRST